MSKSIGEALKEERRSLGLTQEQFIKGIISESFYSKVERGKNEIVADGFGYDPLFYIPEKEKTFAQMTTDEKNEISHRGNAVRKLLQELPAWLEQFD